MAYAGACQATDDGLCKVMIVYCVCCVRLAVLLHDLWGGLSVPARGEWGRTVHAYSREQYYNLMLSPENS